MAESVSSFGFELKIKITMIITMVQILIRKFVKISIIFYKRKNINDLIFPDISIASQFVKSFLHHHTNNNRRKPIAITMHNSQRERTQGYRVVIVNGKEEGSYNAEIGRRAGQFDHSSETDRFVSRGENLSLFRSERQIKHKDRIQIAS